MTAAGTTTSEKYFEPNSALSEIPFHKCETFVAICSAQNQHHLLGTSPQCPGSPSLASTSPLAPCYHPLRAIIISLVFFFFFWSYTALTFTLALLALSSKTWFQSCKCELLSTCTWSTCDEFSKSSWQRTTLPPPQPDPPLLSKAILKMQQHLPVSSPLARTNQKNDRYSRVTLRGWRRSATLRIRDIQCKHLQLSLYNQGKEVASWGQDSPSLLEIPISGRDALLFPSTDYQRGAAPVWVSLQWFRRVHLPPPQMGSGTSVGPFSATIS